MIKMSRQQKRMEGRQATLPRLSSMQEEEVGSLQGRGRWPLTIR